MKCQACVAAVIHVSMSKVSSRSGVMSVPRYLKCGQNETKWPLQDPVRQSVGSFSLQWEKGGKYMALVFDFTSFFGAPGSPDD